MAAPRIARVLLVDDDASMRRACARLLAKHGCEVTAVASGEAALASLEQASCELVLTDFSMPGMTGADLLQAVRERAPDVRRVLMSTREVPGLAELHASGVVQAFLTKPLDAAAVAALLAQSGASASS